MIQEKFGRENRILQSSKESQKNFSKCKSVVESWRNKFHYKAEDAENEIAGLRQPQIGALHAVKAHWTVSDEVATIVMPTGTGKTETMLSVIVSEMCSKVLVVVPSNLLRKQVSEKCLEFGILKDLEVVDKIAKNPVIALLKSYPKEKDEIKQIVNKSNIIVTTMSLLSGFSSRDIKTLSENCTHLMIDEAHHIPSDTWSKVKESFKTVKVLQFTATPFRNDKKRIDGKIIYNFPLMLAQKQGYFKPIYFKAVYEFDNVNSDLAIAKAVIEQLKQDMNDGLEHVVLVRAKTKKRSKELFEKIYQKNYKEYNPVLINSDTYEKDKKEYFEKIENGTSKIIVGVDMFGEGIDIPSLKIAAIHDKYKSLPITLQFIGRFARSKKNLGTATIVANIADEEMSEGIRELYSQDADWNYLLRDLSNEAIGKELSFQEFVNGFEQDGANLINVKLLKPKVSMFAYRVGNKKWNPHGWKNILNEEKCYFKINEEKKVLIIVEKVESKIDWSLQKDNRNINWQLHLVYWNKEKELLYINSTNKTIANRLAKSIYPENKKIEGEEVFKCLHGIKRLMFATVGLNMAINGPIRYKMFAGIDIGEGLTEAQKKNCFKSNVFGIGYDGKSKASIGCSYKGTIWSRWVESIDFWMNWCDEVGDKITNSHIDVEHILDGALIPKIVTERPKKVPISIEWPLDLMISNDQRVSITSNHEEFNIYEIDIKLDSFEDNGTLQFSIGNSQIDEKYEMIFDPEGNVEYKYIKLSNLKIKYGKETSYLIQFFTENHPRIKFSDQSSLEGNYYVELKKASSIQLSNKNIEIWDWKDINIKKESQGNEKRKDSIQYKVIENLLKKIDYSVVFDDDNSGEIADVIGIIEGKNRIVFELYHCKFSKGKKPGSRVGDLYEVCGQAEKSVSWKQDPVAIINRMILREQRRLRNEGPSRIEKGSLRKLNEIKNKLRIYDYDMSIFIVQPGVDSKAISPDMNELLCNTKLYLMETYGIPFKLICS